MGLCSKEAICPFFYSLIKGLGDLCKTWYPQPAEPHSPQECLYLVRASWGRDPEDSLLSGIRDPKLTFFRYLAHVLDLLFAQLSLLGRGSRSQASQCLQ